MMPRPHLMISSAELGLKVLTLLNIAALAEGERCPFRLDEVVAALFPAIISIVPIQLHEGGRYLLTFATDEDLVEFKLRWQ